MEEGGGKSREHFAVLKGVARPLDGTQGGHDEKNVENPRLKY